MGASSTTKTFLARRLRQGAVGEFFRELRDLAESAGYRPMDGFQVFITRSDALNEHTVWELDQLFAVGSLSSGNPSSITFIAHGPDTFEVEMSSTTGGVRLLVVAPTAQLVTTILELAERYLKASSHTSPTGSGSTAGSMSGVEHFLDWLERHPVFRALAILAVLFAVLGGIVLVLQLAGVLHL